MKKARRFISLILSVTILISACLANVQVFADNESDTDFTFAENAKEYFVQQKVSLPEPQEPEIKYPDRDSINTANDNDLFNAQMPRANTDRERSGTLLGAWRNYAEANGIAQEDSEADKKKMLSQLAEKELSSTGTLLPVTENFSSGSNYTFAETGFADGYSVKEVSSALVLSDVLGVGPADLLTDDNSLTNTSVALTDAEEDFLYFYPADINALRSAVASKYGAASDESYEELFLSIAASAEDDEELQSIDAPVTPFFGLNSGENEYIDVKSGDLKYTELL